MAVESKFVNTDLGTGTLLDSKSNGGTSVKFLRVTEEVAAADDNGSVYGIALISSSDTIKSLSIWNDAITAGTDYDIGIYDYDRSDNSIGTVVDKDLFSDGLDLSSAQDGVNVLTAPNIDELHKPIWEYAALSLTADPKKTYVLAITANTVGSAAGTITLDIEVAA